jgi:hypothetical protein
MRCRGSFLGPRGASTGFSKTDRDALQREIDANYDFFLEKLALLTAEHRNRYALLRNCKILGFFDNPGDAYRAAIGEFSDELFSIQQVTDEPVELGIYSIW